MNVRKEWHDAMQSGDFCQSCGGYMGTGEGVPRTCIKCQEKRKSVTKIEEEEK